MIEKAELQQIHAKYKKQYDSLARIHKHATDMVVLFDKVDTDKAKAELERNKKLLQELTTEKHALEKNLSSERHTLIELTTETNRLQHMVTFLKKEQDSFQEERLPRLRHEASELLTTCDKLKDDTLPLLRYEADELQATRDKLKTEVDTLKEKIGTLQKEAEALQADADATRRHKAKSALEDNIPPLSASHAQLNTEENALKEKRLLEQGKVTGILEKFNTNIAKMKPKTQKVAESLAEKFANYANEYFETARTEKDKQKFIASCHKAVDIEKPTLNDVGFWRKVQNMLTALWNAITPAGINMNFFKTDLANKTESTLSDLENIKGMNQ